MRRPVVGVFLAFACGVGFEYYFDINGCIMLTSAIASAFFCLFAQKREWKIGLASSKKRGLKSFRFFAGLFLLLFCLGGFFLWNEGRTLNVPLATENMPIMLKGNVLSVEKKEDDYFKLLVMASEVTDLKEVSHKKILVNVYEDITQINGLENYGTIVGKTIVMTGNVSHPQGRRNPRTYDYSLYLKSRGIVLTMVTDDGGIKDVEGRVNLVLNRIAVFKYSFVERLEASMKDEVLAGLAVGMLLGDKTEIDEETYESFQRNGTAHILAISGLHIGAIYLCINTCVNIRVITYKKTHLKGRCRKRKQNRSSEKLNRWMKQIIVMIILVGYAAMTGFAPSVVRAVSMILLHILSKLLYRRYDMLTAASFVALVTLIKNPYMLFNTGFQLSYLAIFSLSVILPVVASLKQNPWIEERLEHNKMLTFLIEIFIPIAALQIGMTPLTAYVFNYFSLGGVLANIPIIFLSGFIIPVGLMLMPLSALQPVIPGMLGLLLRHGFDALAFVMKLLINLMEGVNAFFYHDGIFSYNVASPSIWFLCMYYGMIFYFSSELARIHFLRKQKERLAIAAISILIASCMLQGADYIKDDFHDAQLVFIDVGQGDALHVRTPSGKNILIDGGGNVNYDVGKKTLMPYFLKNGVTKIDFVIATHLHVDHYKGLTEVAQCIPVETFGTFEGKRVIEAQIASEMAIKPGQILYLSKGDSVQVDKDVYVEILWPEPAMTSNVSGDEEEDENTSSLIIKVVYGEVSVLMTGDIDSEGEHMMTSAYTCDDVFKCNILKVPHHGSKYSSSDEFIETVNPQMAVIQVGKNNYGHPNQGIIEKYVKNDIIVCRNDLSGAIGVKNIKKDRFSIVTMLQP